MRRDIIQMYQAICRTDEKDCGGKRNAYTRYWLPVRDVDRDFHRISNDKTNSTEIIRFLCSLGALSLSKRMTSVAPAPPIASVTGPNFDSHSRNMFIW